MDSNECKKKSQWNQRYRVEYTKEWPEIQASKLADTMVFCTTCSFDLSVAHGGRNDIKRHIESNRHKELMEIRLK